MNQNLTRYLDLGGQNPILSLFFNIFVPVAILQYANHLAPYKIILLTALFFPIVYAAMELHISKKLNIISLIGLTSVLLTGVIGLFSLNPFWLAVKEATIPFIFFLIFLTSAFSKEPLIKLFLRSTLDMDKIWESSDKKQKQKLALTYQQATLVLCLGYLFSTIVNFILANLIVTVPAGSQIFNQQLARLTTLSLPLITVPTFIFAAISIGYSFYQIKTITNQSFSDLLSSQKKSPL